MDKTDKQTSAGVGKKFSLWFVSPAALVFLGFVVSKLVEVLFDPRESRRHGPAVEVLYYLALTVIILTALYLSASLLGRKAGVAIGRKARGPVAAALLGISVALGCLVAGVAAWIVFHFIAFTVSAQDFRFTDILYMSSFVGLAILIYGIIPAILLGALYGLLVRRRLAQSDMPEVTVPLERSDG